MTGYKATLEGADELLKIFKNFPDIFRDEIKPALKAIGYEVENNAKPETPVFMGTLRASITHEITVQGGQAFVKIAPSLKNEIYPVVMELGRRPGSKPPPAAALVRWVELVIRPEPEDVVRIAFLVAQSIGRKGIKGREYMKKGLEKSEGKIADHIEKAASRMVERIKRSA